jgi:hypothetical protein
MQVSEGECQAALIEVGTPYLWHVLGLFDAHGATVLAASPWIADSVAASGNKTQLLNSCSGSIAAEILFSKVATRGNDHPRTHTRATVPMEHETRW